MLKYGLRRHKHGLILSCYQLALQFGWDMVGMYGDALDLRHLQLLVCSFMSDTKGEIITMTQCLHNANGRK